ncbi:HhoA/HhoB/HtrA family serine endopeptidase [Pseudanabaena sp. PCC 6802]|uniref:HhoA/HhoB/HtrA family serine endopeptidase n=1 Tax=Pseudanabaena sp. PCC 6802 TaxID=118173 RepID=UPI000349683B|nr:HhoA/HhoB/HtrA family serine endopeptidase [Pseudanabaena sp. PCC 6802]
MASEKRKMFPLVQIVGYSLAGLIGAGVAVITLKTLSPSQNFTNRTFQPPMLSLEGEFVATAVKKVGTAVVRIDTEQTIRLAPDPALNDPILRQFLGLTDADLVPQQKLQRGIGSGFITDRSGLILTNAHVVRGADKVTVTLTDGRQFRGEVRGADLLMDLAVVKINPTGQALPVAPLGDSSKVRVGDWAIAVGNPLGLNNTVTLGIISNLSRSSSQIGMPDKRLDLIQTDAAINPGNSGGPLLNKSGEVIGINTAIRAEAQGIGFAIPIDIAKAAATALADGKQVAHPYLGIHMITLTPHIARENNSAPNAPIQLPEIDGVVVLQAPPNTPAGAAGVRPGDVIVDINGQSITTAEQLQRIVESGQVNQVLQVKLRRGSQIVSLSIRIGDLQPTR